MGFGSDDAASKGGKARAKALTAGERKEIAKRAAARRWGNIPAKAPTALREAPLAIGGIEFDCAVLDDDKQTRVVSERAFSRAIGAKRGGSHWQRMKQDPSGANLPVFLSANNLRPYISVELADALSTPVMYITRSGLPAHGIRAELIPEILDVYLKAADGGVLTDRQKGFAHIAQILMRGLATTGIIALIDEATGFQDLRTRNALAKILEDYIAKELRKWVSTFPTSFFKELCRLKKVEFSANMRLPRYFGRMVNDLVYDRLAPAVRRELEARNPVTETGRRKHKHFQWLSEGVGHPKLLHHLGLLEGLAKGFADGDYDGFMVAVNRALPKPLPLFDGLPTLSTPMVAGATEEGVATKPVGHHGEEAGAA